MLPDLEQERQKEWEYEFSGCIIICRCFLLFCFVVMRVRECELAMGGWYGVFMIRENKIV